MAEVGSAFVSVLPSARGFGRKLDSEVGGEVDSAGKRLGSRLGTAMKVGALGGGAALVALLKGSADEAREAQKVGALTTQIIKSTGGAAKVSAQQVGDLATAISNKTGVDDEAIQAGANLLLTFKNVRNELGKGNQVFDRATRAASDLSAAGFGDMAGTSKQLGKALNDPVKGVTALGRAGVTFTEDQKGLIKSLVEGGDVLSAQKLILREVESQVGGAAAASATAGEKAAVAFGNLKEQIGTALLPVIDSLANTFTTKIAPALSSFISGMQSGTGVGGAFVSAVRSLKAAFDAVVPVVVKVFTFVADNKAAFGTFAGVILTVVGAMKAWAVIQGVINVLLAANPVGIVVVAIAALAAGIVYAYKESETFRGFVQTLWVGLKAIAGFVTGTLVPAVVGFGRALVDGVRLIADFHRAALAKFAEVVTFVATIPSRVLGALGDLGSTLYSAGRDLIQGLIDGIKDMLPDIGGAIGAVAGKVRDFFPGSPVKEGPLKSWNRGGAGKRLVGLLADGLGDMTPVERAAARLASGVNVRGTSMSGAALVGVGATSGQSIHGVLSIDRDGVAYIEGVARAAVLNAASERETVRHRAALDGRRP